MYSTCNFGNSRDRYSEGCLLVDRRHNVVGESFTQVYLSCGQKIETERFFSWKRVAVSVFFRSYWPVYKLTEICPYNGFSPEHAWSSSLFLRFFDFVVLPLSCKQSFLYQVLKCVYCMCIIIIFHFCPFQENPGKFPLLFTAQNGQVYIWCGKCFVVVLSQLLLQK